MITNIPSIQVIKMLSNKSIHIWRTLRSFAHLTLAIVKASSFTSTPYSQTKSTCVAYPYSPSTPSLA